MHIQLEIFADHRGGWGGHLMIVDYPLWTRVITYGEMADTMEEVLQYIASEINLVKNKG